MKVELLSSQLMDVLEANDHNHSVATKLWKHRKVRVAMRCSHVEYARVQDLSLQ